MISETMLNLISIFTNDFVLFGTHLGSLWALFWKPLGGLGASLCRQVGAKGVPKRMPKGVLAPKSLQVASGTSFLRIWDVGRSDTSLETLFGRSWEIHGVPS